MCGLRPGDAPVFVANIRSFDSAIGQKVEANMRDPSSRDRLIPFDGEVFASAPDQVIVVRLTASSPGQISFEARLQTPQRASIDARGESDLVMRGVNGDGRGTTADGRAMTGGLRFEARVRVVATGGTHKSSNEAIAVRGASDVAGTKGLVYVLG